MQFRPFLTTAFSVSNAALVSANSDNSDPLLVSLSLPNSPLPGSLSNPNLFNEYLPLPDLLPLESPAPGNEPIPFNLNLDPIHSETLADTPTFSPKTPQEASMNSGGDGGESSIVTPPNIDAQTQTYTDDFNGMCSSDSSAGRKRRRGQSSCGNPAMLEFHQRVPKEPEAGRTTAAGKNDKRSARDDEWIIKTLKGRFGRNWRRRDEYQLQDYMATLGKRRRDACIEQSNQAGSYNRPYAFCCLGPSQDVIKPAKLRLARRQNIRLVTNWFNCDFFFEGRPFCDPPGIFSLCCANYWDEPEPLLNEPPDLWRWGYKAADCVEAILD